MWEAIKDKLGEQFGRSGVTPLLPRTGKYATASFWLHWLKRQPNDTAQETVTSIGGILAPLHENVSNERAVGNYAIFQDIIVLADALATLMGKKRGGKVITEPANVFLYEKSHPGDIKAKKKKVRAELKKLRAEASTRPEVLQALENRKNMWDSLRDEYTAAFDALGINVQDKLVREEYFRHQIVQYRETFMQEQLKSGYGKIKANIHRGFLRQRKGSPLPYYTDYLSVETETVAKMRQDIKLVNVLEIIMKEHDKGTALRGLANEEEGIKYGQEDKFKRWLKDNHPDMALWKPSDVSHFYLATTITESIAAQIHAGTVSSVNINKTNLGKRLVLGGSGKSWVIDKRVAAQLDNFVIPNKRGAGAPIHAATVKIKQWYLQAPHRIPKYNFRNAFGDSDAVIAGNPATRKEVIEATKELFKHLRTGEASPELKKWMFLGGFGTTMSAQELGQVKQLKEFMLSPTFCSSLVA